MRKYDLEERLTSFSLLVMEIVNKTSRTMNGIQLARQLSRSGTSVSLNYGEAQSAESRRDFIHKLKIVLKELNETKICLKLIHKTNLCRQSDKLMAAEKENEELILIFARSIKTAKINDQKARQNKENLPKLGH
jgi:four helix bundle protein